MKEVDVIKSVVERIRVEAPRRTVANEVREIVEQQEAQAIEGIRRQLVYAAERGIRQLSLAELDIGLARLEVVIDWLKDQGFSVEKGWMGPHTIRLCGER